jgi:hypothetical protein
MYQGSLLGYVHTERASLSMSHVARCDGIQNQPVVCNTAVHAGHMAPGSTPSAKLCEAPGNKQCWLFAWRDLSSVQCINGMKFGIPNTAATKTLISYRKI